MKSKISIMILLAIITIFLIQLNVQAVVISSDKQVESGGGTVTISVTSNQTLGAYTLKLVDTAGLALSGATGQHVSSDFKTVTGSSAEGTKNLGTFTFKIPTVDKDTKYNIKFSITGMETPDLEQVADETNTAVITVKVKQVQTTPSTNSQTQQPTTTTPSTPEKPKVEEKPNFTEVNKKLYAENDINLRASWSTNSKATKIEKGTELTVTATSNNKINGYVWYRVSYNGQTKYVASNLLSTTKPEEEPEQPVEEPKEETPEEPTTAEEQEENTETTEELKGLKSLEIEGLTLSPEFETGTYNYEAIFKENITELKINTETIEEDGTVVIAGNTNIQEGENLITIIVYNAKSEAVATYQIVVNKNTLDLTSTDELLKYGNQAATLKTTIYMVAIILTTILLITVLIVRYKTQNKEETQFGQEEKTTKEKQGKFAIEEEKKGKHF